MVKWVVAGLGNPGKRYQNTRHNLGFMVVESLAARLEAEAFKFSPKFSADFVEKQGVLLLKPQTFMNDSGKTVVAALQFYKIQLEHLIVIHDDLDIPLGMTKMGLGKGPKVHNGIHSIESRLGAKEFWRMRVGVDNRTPTDRADMTPPEYVLMQLTEAEKVLVIQSIDEAVDKIMETMRTQ